eukprot:848059-Amphidinium_carterae.1
MSGIQLREADDYRYVAQYSQQIQPGCRSLSSRVTISRFSDKGRVVHGSCVPNLQPCNKTTSEAHCCHHGLEDACTALDRV